ncbi:MAG: T9SS type A sorting domain-containing protein [Bacteroidia bacterium]|nr:T9SS type A sorting domain-containing protein [Bacteroidia bacterium]
MSFGPGMSLTFNAYFIKVDSAGSGTCHTVAANPVITNPNAVVGTPSISIGTGGTTRSTSTQVTSGLNVLDICVPVGEKSISTENYVSIYPNPFSTETTLRISDLLITNEVAEFVFHLYDVLGREITSYSIKSFIPNHELTLTIPRGNVKSGIYFYELNSPSRIIGKGKLVITN